MFLDQLRNIFGLQVTDRKRLDLAHTETEKVYAAEQALERERLLLLHKRFIGKGAEFGEQDLTKFSIEETIDLSIARKDKVIWDRPFRSFTVVEHLPGEMVVSPHRWGLMLPKVYIRFNALASPLYRVRYGEIKGKFNKIYLTNTAQSGYSMTFVVSSDPDGHFGMSGKTMAVLEGISLLKGITVKKNLYDLYIVTNEGVKRARATPITYNVAIINPNAEYSQTIPVNTKVMRAGLADLASFRTAWVTGKVAAPTSPYWTQPANIPIVLTGLDFQVAKTLYFADAVGTKVMQIECYT